YVPEPYNPEAPGMNVVNRVNYWVPPPVHHMTPAHHPPPPLPPTASGIPSMLFNLNELPPLFHKTHRARELIGVPTVGNLTMDKEREKERNKEVNKATDENSENCLKTFSVGEKNKSANTLIVNELKRKSFDYNRLGASPRKITKKFNNNRSTLEVRKIPQHLNTIAMLNSHFSKFGRIVNLQVGYDSDPEAALVQFMTDAEATAAYRCAEAILNNRFIKVFYHNPQKKEENQTSSITNEICVNNSNRTHHLQSNNSNEQNIEEPQQNVLWNNMVVVECRRGWGANGKLGIFLVLDSLALLN
ncbi:zinc finger protein swm, partial [Nephila pilipes]